MTKTEKKKERLSIKKTKAEIKEKEHNQTLDVITSLRHCLESCSLDESKSSGLDQVWMKTFTDDQRDVMANKLMEYINKL